MVAERFLSFIERAPSGRRAEAVTALARAYLYAEVDDDTRDAMEAAMTVILDDPSPAVRTALAATLAPSPDAPRHVILALAADRPEIAATVLSQSPVFIDAELVDIVAAADASLQTAVARRSGISGAVAAAIAEIGEPEAARALLANPCAAIASISLRRLADRFAETPDIRETLLARPDLPSDLRQALVRRLGAALCGLPVVRNVIGEEKALIVAGDACQRATIAIAAETATAELPALVEHLRVTGQLTTALLLRAVCAGNVAFFETALAILARMPEARVVSLIRAGRSQAFRAAYDKAGLPAVAFDAFVAAIEACRKAAEEGGPADRYRFSRSLVNSVLLRYEAITDGEMNELAAMLRRFGAEEAREAARSLLRPAAAA